MIEMTSTLPGFLILGSYTVTIDFWELRKAAPGKALGYYPHIIPNPCAASSILAGGTTEM